jgi:Flp pilus assembly protein TadD
MAWKNVTLVSVIAVLVGWGSAARAGEIKITLPRSSHLTPVQRLNRKGVEAIRKHAYQKAEGYFYKAYLLDPDDPFTLNNLGYISELQSQLDRAQNFYRLAGEQATDAVIAMASSPRVQGWSVKAALAIPELPFEIDHDNVQAVRMLSQGLAPEADLFLTQVLEKDPSNVFTLNNLGVAKEMEGESHAALKLYDQAAATGSSAPAIVTLNPSWRGKPASAMAERNARNLRARLESQSSTEAQLAELNVRGVLALNRNDLRDAEQDFRAAFELDPTNAFAANNVGYLSEINGDRETAEFYYDKAQILRGANLKVGLATRSSVEGSPLSRVASENGSQVQVKVAQEQSIRRAQHAPVALFHRDNTPVKEPGSPPSAAPQP